MTNPFYLLTSKKDSAKRKLVMHFLTCSEGSHYVRQLAARLNVDPANLSRDLKALGEEGFLNSKWDGNQKYYLLNETYAYLDNLRSLLAKTRDAPEEQPNVRKYHVYVIAGPNGAGKTTFAKTFLPDHLDCRLFVNADLIAAGLAPLKPEGAQLRAGKLLLEEIRRTGEKRVDFGFETTLSGKTYVRMFQRLRERGYAIHLFFLWIPNVQLSLKRIEDRVRRGGHHIPEKVARRRFKRGIQNLFHVYQPLLSSWSIFDNSSAHPKTVAYGEAGERIILDEDMFGRLQKIGAAA